MKPKAVIFFCNWTNYPGLKLSECSIGEMQASQKYMVSMCSGRISPELILEAFSHGVWGIMIAACPPGECEHDGNYKTFGRVTLLRLMLAQLGLDTKRLRVEWIDKGEIAALEKAVDSFIETVQELGPVVIDNLSS